ncbi:prephenate dehydrogenase [Methylocystis sp. IM3]|uniref:prephenate dehydrogenase n=1 Tax=unclassified Methylocystis TaxID=2625913 RepID=UPI0030FC901C
MSSNRTTAFHPFIGVIGFGAFGRLMAQHLSKHFRVYAYDPVPPQGGSAEMCGAMLTDLSTAAKCPVVIIATPVDRLEGTIEAIIPHLRRGALVLDVGSVKKIPAEIMRRNLPEQVEIVATHPLFGPQSARNGIRGLKIAVCPIRGRRGRRVAAFLRKVLGLRVIMTTPDAHDREAAMAQALMHLIAKALIEMEPLPTRMTTRSFDLLMEAVDMVRYDAPEVVQAIEGSNPYVGKARRRFVQLVSSQARTFSAPNEESMQFGSGVVNSNANEIEPQASTRDA